MKKKEALENLFNFPGSMNKCAIDGIYITLGEEYGSVVQKIMDFVRSFRKIPYILEYKKKNENSSQLIVKTEIGETAAKLSFYEDVLECAEIKKNHDTRLGGGYLIDTNHVTKNVPLVTVRNGDAYMVLDGYKAANGKNWLAWGASSSFYSQFITYRIFEPTKTEGLVEKLVEVKFGGESKTESASENESKLRVEYLKEVSSGLLEDYKILQTLEGRLNRLWEDTLMKESEHIEHIEEGFLRVEIKPGVLHKCIVSEKNTLNDLEYIETVHNRVKNLQSKVFEYNSCLETLKDRKAHAQRLVLELESTIRELK